MKRFWNDTKKYWEYVKSASKAQLKSEVAGAHLGWLWWLLDPLLFMLIYTFVSVIVFDRSQQYLASFIFIGLSSWNFFQHVVKNSVTLVSKNSGIVSKVYIPKFVLIYIEMGIESIKMLISYLLVIGTMILYRIPITFKVVYIIPIFLTLYVFTFGCATILMHFGVFVQDLSNVINAFLRLVFYLSGVFYSISKISEPYRTILLNFNPIAAIMDGLRQCVLYHSNPQFLTIGVWFVMGIILSIIGVRTIYKYENSYVKVM